MQPDLRPVDFLQVSLEAALRRWRPSATLGAVRAEKLTRYAHELAFGGDAPDRRNSEATADIRVEGWVALAPDERGGARARRHYLVADVDLREGSEWFPALLSMAAKLRSHLDPDEQADVAMLLVTQPGAAAAGRIAVLERNEAFAQVLVWPPSLDPQDWPSEANRFVARLRIGPIEGPSEGAGGDLSPVAAVFEGTTIGSEVRESWRDILMNTEIRDVERAQRLVAVVDARVGATNDG